ncbi:PREDICTED: uncharacterized protein LOC105562296 [Vollenhovia emeryi]|uniref:uncharacterized protein LOC105562296 n=1 Tax=Vollenhovia emeryi TaxID=411798 RepID=UPI0005F4E53D|nr:PREDICTED: uncharacterized protein LOC105562296 [Vollenhovia emeryi]
MLENIDNTYVILKHLLLHYCMCSGTVQLFRDTSGRGRGMWAVLSTISQLVHDPYFSADGGYYRRQCQKYTKYCRPRHERCVEVRIRGRSSMECDQCRGNIRACARLLGKARGHRQEHARAFA